MTIERWKKIGKFQLFTYTNVENNLSTSPRDAFHWHSPRLSFLEILKRLFLHFIYKRNPNLLFSLSCRSKEKKFKIFKRFPIFASPLTIESESPKSKNRLVYFSREIWNLDSILFVLISNHLWKWKIYWCAWENLPSVEPRVQTQEKFYQTPEYKTYNKLAFNDFAKRVFQ